MSTAYYREALTESRAAYASALEESQTDPDCDDVREELGRASYNLVLLMSHFAKTTLAELVAVSRALDAFRVRHPGHAELDSWTLQTRCTVAMVHADLGFVDAALRVYASVDDAEVDAHTDPEVREHQARAALRIMIACTGTIDWHPEHWQRPTGLYWGWQREVCIERGEIGRLYARIESLRAAHPRESDLAELRESAAGLMGGDVVRGAHFVMDRAQTLAEACYQAAVADDLDMARAQLAMIERIQASRAGLKRLPAVLARARHAIALALSRRGDDPGLVAVVAASIEAADARPGDRALRKQVAWTLCALVEGQPVGSPHLCTLHGHLERLAARAPKDKGLQVFLARSTLMVARRLSAADDGPGAAAAIDALAALHARLPTQADIRAAYARALATAVLWSGAETRSAELARLAAAAPRDRKVARCLTLVEAHRASS